MKSRVTWPAIAAFANIFSIVLADMGPNQYYIDDDCSDNMKRILSDSIEGAKDLVHAAVILKDKAQASIKGGEMDTPEIELIKALFDPKMDTKNLQDHIGNFDGGSYRYVWR
jgi:hypothetical protein